MRRSHTITALLAAVALSVVAAAPASSATPRSTLTIYGSTSLDRSTIHLGPGQRTFEGLVTGTFTADGAITDGGTESCVFLFASYGAPDLSSDHAISCTFAGSAGSIIVRMQALHHPYESSSWYGNWGIVGASGAYAGLHGAGTVHVSVTGEATQYVTIVDTWTGSVQ